MAANRPGAVFNKLKIQWEIREGQHYWWKYTSSNIYYLSVIKKTGKSTSIAQTSSNCTARINTVLKQIWPVSFSNVLKSDPIFALLTPPCVRPLLFLLKKRQTQAARQNKVIKIILKIVKELLRPEQESKWTWGKLQCESYKTNFSSH